MQQNNSHNNDQLDSAHSKVPSATFCCVNIDVDFVAENKNSQGQSINPEQDGKLHGFESVGQTEGNQKTSGLTDCSVITQARYCLKDSVTRNVKNCLNRVL